MESAHCVLLVDMSTGEPKVAQPVKEAPMESGVKYGVRVATATLASLTTFVATRDYRQAIDAGVTTSGEMKGGYRSWGSRRTEAEKRAAGKC